MGRCRDDLEGTPAKTFKHHSNVVARYQPRASHPGEAHLSLPKFALVKQALKLA